MTVFFGEFATDSALLFAGFTLAAAPVIGLYILMSHQYIKGLTAGAVKGQPRSRALDLGREIRRCEQGRPDVLDDEPLRVGLLARLVPLGIG